ncbi:MAG: hypothetical protein OQK24_12730 [Magnetovibrio sp.]|nr:hypothetical protein [Magnetovibrio sp.]
MARLTFTLPPGVSSEDVLDALYNAGIDEPIGVGVEGYIAIDVDENEDEIDKAVRKVQLAVPGAKCTNV